MFGHMNKYAILVLAALLVAALVITTAVAAPRGAKMRQCDQGMGQCQGMQQQIADKLGLTEDQKAQIKTIVEKYREQIRQVMQSSLTQDEKRTQAQALRQEMRGAIEQVLTPEQREKARQMLANAGKQMKQRFHECLKKLDLSAEQTDKIKSIREAGMEKVRAIKVDTTLSAEEKRSRVQVIRKETHEQVMSVLTPEQRAKLSQMCPKMGQGGQGKMQRKNG